VSKGKSFEKRGKGGPFPPPDSAAKKGRYLRGVRAIIPFWISPEGRGGAFRTVVFEWGTGTFEEGGGKGDAQSRGLEKFLSELGRRKKGTLLL